jgi:putative aldouronate transport system substrate-binding protein
LTDDNYYLYKLGVKGEHWQWGDDDKPEYLVDWLNDQNEKIKHGLGNPASMIPVIDRTQWEPEISPFFDTINERVIENVFQGGVPAMADHPEIDVDFKETLVRVIIGDLPLLELEKAQQRWYQSGGTEITEQVNEWYAGQQ